MCTKIWLVAALCGFTTTSANYIIDEQTIEQLELVSKANLVEQLFHAATQVGKTSLAEFIKYPTADIKEIYRRQRIIKSIAESEQLRTTLGTILSEFGKIEVTLLNFWKEDPAPSQNIAQLYPPPALYKSYKHAQQPWVLELFRRLDDCAVLCFLPLAVLHLRSAINGGALQEIGKLPQQSISEASKNLFYHGSQLLMASITIPFTYYETVQHFKNMQRTLTQLHTKYRSLAHAFQLLRKVFINLTAHRKKLGFIAESAPIYDICFKQCSSELAQLYTILDNPSWTKPFSYFSHIGNILAAHRLMIQVRDELIPAMLAIGKLDSYYALAMLMQEHPQSWCYVQCAQYEKPFLKAEKLWNPFVLMNVVPNSVALGYPYGPQGMVITGQHSGGKSTLLKGLALAMVLAQTFGIAPAQSMIFTPFHKVCTFLHTPESGEEQRSLFTAEVTQAKAILDAVGELTQGQKAVVICDEVFKGSGGEAEGLTYQYLEELMNFQHALSLHATHHKKLTQLEEITKGWYQNYKMEVMLSSRGKLVRNYRLERGTTFHTIAQQILAEQGLLKYKGQ
jgi:hypothetical protein